MLMATPSETSATPNPQPISQPFSFSDPFMSSGTYSFTSLLTSGSGGGAGGLEDLLPPSVISPASFFSIPQGLSAAELSDSPVLFSAGNALPFPTTGNFPTQSFDWKNNSNKTQLQEIKNEEQNFPDFYFPTQTLPKRPYNMGDETWGYQEAAKQDVPSSDKPEFDSIQSFLPDISTVQTNDEPKLNDGYNWRKYGQKQVNGIENPRNYYQCSYPNCPSKKKAERSTDGLIEEIVYRGIQNHPKPQSTRKSSSFSSVSSSVIQSNEIREQSYGSNGIGIADSSIATTENSSISVEDGDLEQSSQKFSSLVDELDEDEPNAKRWKGEAPEIENVAVSGEWSKTLREPRVVVQTRSDIDILDDGYKWRKYGQKVVKGNPNPRSYYKCTSHGCPVRKHVERASHDPQTVITTYEGRHNHNIPPARRGRGYSLSRVGASNNNAATELMRTPIIVQSSNYAMPTVETEGPYSLEMFQNPAN